MRTRIERRESAKKKFKRRINLSKSIWCYVGDDLEDWLKRKSDIPHSQGSNWWNAFETKRMKNRQARLKSKQETKKELEEI